MFHAMLAKLSPIGLVIFVVGVVCGFLAPKLAHSFFAKREEKACMVLRLVGVALAILGALILVDVIPV